ncbi:MAG TPA: histidinol dehydrogenase [Candidatus Limnocylindrales bacterium]|nr:histidinol dehydrogenase [Candidatus Limnocylindrales bacterium]
MRILDLTAATEARLIRLREGQDRAAYRASTRIVADVRRRGDASLDAWSIKLDGVNLRQKGLWVSRTEMAAARQRVPREFLRAVAHAAANARRVAEKQMPREWSLTVEPGVTVAQLIRPIDSIGCYIPGGRFALFSTLVMTVVPAQVAGVRRIVAVCPGANDELLAAADLLGVTHLARIGGAQAIAALAYGTKRIAPVEKIFGPGNRFVTAAKQIVSSDCAIDLPAGPTEAIVLARRGNPSWITSDLLAQAEHAPDAGSYLVTSSPQLAQKVKQEVAAQLNLLPRNNPAHASCRTTGAILLARTWEQALDFVNRFAPEHLSLPVGAPSLLKKIRSSGTIFLGPLSAQPFGDYASGSNHVLPTGGWARRRGGLSISDFVKQISVQTIDRVGYRRLASDVQMLARAEGLLAHANAVEVRK